MKYVKSLYTILFVTTFLLTGCSSKDDNEREWLYDINNLEVKLFEFSLGERPDYNPVLFDYDGIGGNLYIYDNDTTLILNIYNYEDYSKIINEQEITSHGLDIVISGKVYKYKPNYYLLQTDISDLPKENAYKFFDFQLTLLKFK